jgi:CelD/BcsL family acetyltransferase involved in cellulose biosynthesis
MSDIQAFSTDDIPAVGGTASQAGHVVLRHASAITVEMADAARLAALDVEWTDLLTRADVSNVLMDPVMVAASADVFPESQCRTLLAWQAHAGGARRLAGIWAFSIGRPIQSAIAMDVLNTPPGPHRYLSAPVVDRAHLDETLHAMLDILANDPQLPRIAALEAMITDSPTMDALRRVLASRGTEPCTLEVFQRPKLEAGVDGKTYLEKALSSSSRKKLRQHRRRLGEKGALTSGVISEPGQVRDALEDFMRIEAAGWKGRQGTALLCDPRNAAFIRKSMPAMAERGRASIHALYLDGKPISMQLVVRAGGAAFTWKTAYDESYQEFSPGMLLLEDYTTAFLADKSITHVDSCAHDDSGYMSVWTGRQPIADIWIDTSRGGSLSFKVTSRLQKLYRDLRSRTKTLYLALQERRKR